MNNARTLLVTGASSGIGLAVCQALLAGGHRVIGLARREAPIPSERYTHRPLDLADLDNLPAALDSLVADHPDIDGLVACAGAGRFGSLEEFSYRQIRELIELNLTGQIFLVRALLPALKRRKQGDIVLMGSEAALAGGRRGAVYSAAKFALRGFAQALRQECAGAGVRVCIVNPGMVDTAFFDDLGFAPGRQADEHLTADDVAAAVTSAIETRPGAAIDEINLSPQKKVIDFGK
jgi:NADP-dependent 3-hydroxy acid dehydrogenase YdfG